MYQLVRTITNKATVKNSEQNTVILVHLDVFSCTQEHLDKNLHSNESGERPKLQTRPRDKRSFVE